MATKMKTGRMTVKTTTRAPGDPKNLKQVTVTGKNPTSGGRTQAQYKSMSAEDQYKEWVSEQRKAPNYEYTAGIGRKAGGSKLSPSELELFNKEQESMGYNMKAKEVWYAKGSEGAEGAKYGKPGFHQVYYADPSKEKQYYKSPAKVTPSTPVKTPEKVKVGNLPTRKLGSSTPSRSLATATKKTEMVNKAIEGPGVKGRSFKKQGSVTNRLKPQGGLARGAEGRKFRKEEKLAGAYTRTKALADENQGPNVVAGAFSKEKKAGYKAMRSDLKAARKETGVKVGSAIRDTRKAQKFEKKEQVGKTSYFTKSKMNEKVEKKTGMKGRMQAGKMRYS
jgi:hypothetical protein